MSTDNQFNEKTGQAVGDALVTKTAQQGSQPGLPSSLGTAQGGEVLSPPTKESLGLPFVGEHGSIATSYNIERTIQGVQALETLSASEKDVRVGGTGALRSSNGTGNMDVTGTSAAYTMLDNQGLNTNYIPNVGNRFAR